MKKVIVALIAVLMSACWPEQLQGTLYTYTIKNESGTNITIKAYRINRPDLAPVIINLPKGEKLTKTYQDGLPPNGYDFPTFFGDSYIDSITVIYENRKFSSFRKDCTARNPLNFCNINPEVTFIFTAQDYEDAQDCNGICD